MGMGMGYEWEHVVAARTRIHVNDPLNRLYRNHVCELCALCGLSFFDTDTDTDSDSDMDSMLLDK